MLAREIYDRLVSIKGAEEVVLNTGEEKIRWKQCETRADNIWDAPLPRRRNQREGGPIASWALGGKAARGPGSMERTLRRAYAYAFRAEMC